MQGTVIKRIDATNHTVSGVAGQLLSTSQHRDRQTNTHCTSHATYQYKLLAHWNQGLQINGEHW